MKLYVLWDWNPELSQTITWKDGLAAALKLLRERHDVTINVPGPDGTIDHPYFPIRVVSDIVADVEDIQPDAILIWGDMTRPHTPLLAPLGIPMAICFAGGEALGDNHVFYDHIFVESQVYLDTFKKAMLPCSIAFGTNTELFKPVEQPKVFDTIFPATFAAWKRHDLYAKAVQGKKALACGYMYTSHEQECWQVCLDNGVVVLPHVSADVLHRLYAASEVCVVTSSSAGGSQRTVLEALAMNLPVIVTDSDKFDYDHLTRVEPTIEAVRGAIETVKQTNTRDYVLQNWSEHNYADALEKGLQSIV